MYDNKWINSLIPGILMHSALGLIFTWTALSNRISASFGQPCDWLYPIVMISMGLSCVLFGYFVDKCIKCSSRICIGTFIIGILSVVCSLNLHIIPWLIIGCILLGISMGFMILIPVKSISLWFSGSKGLAIGASLVGFGISRGLSSFLVLVAFNDYSPYEIVGFMGVLCFIPLTLSLLLTKYGGEYQRCDMSLKLWRKSVLGVFGMKKLYVFWNILFLGIITGYSLLSYKEEFLISLGLEHISINLLILGAIFNILGRLGTGGWADLVKRKSRLISITMYLSSLSCVLGFIWPGFIPITIVLCSLFYGSLVTITPISLEQRYGNRRLGRNVGFVFSAITTGGIGGYYLTEVISELPSSIFRTILLTFGIMYAIGLYLSSDLLEETLGETIPDRNP